MNFVVGRCAAVVDVPVDGEAVLVFVRDVGRALAQFLANLLSYDERRRPRVAETQHEENHAQQGHLQLSINRQRGIVPAVARRYAIHHPRADGSSTMAKNRGRSTSVRGRVRTSLVVSGG